MIVRSFQVESPAWLAKIEVDGWWFYLCEFVFAATQRKATRFPSARSARLGLSAHVIPPNSRIKIVRLVPSLRRERDAVIEAVRPCWSVLPARVQNALLLLEAAERARR